MTHSAIATTVDCRGQRCPAPILATAKAAKTIGSSGGFLEIAADDDAFPFDIRAWCRSSGAELVELVSTQGTFTARVRVKGSNGAGSTPAPASQAPASPATLRPEPSRTEDSHPPSSASSSRTLSYVDVGTTKPTMLDCRGERCPGPILQLARQARMSAPGEVIEVLSDDPAFAMDVRSWCRSAGATLISLHEESGWVRATVRTSTQVAAASDAPAIAPQPAAPVVAATPDTLSLVGVPAQDRPALLDCAAEGRPGGGPLRIVVDDPNYSLELLQWVKQHEHRLVSMDARGPLVAEIELAPRPEPTAALARVGTYPVDNRCTLLVLHNDREALLAALLIGVGAASQGMEVVMFFTFWGLNLLRGDEPNEAMPKERVSWAQRMFKWMMPRGPKQQKLGKLDMAGIGRGMLGSIMKRYSLMDIPELMNTAEEHGIRFVACTMSMQVMGITKRDLCARRNIEYGGVAAFVDAASRSRMALTF